MHPGPPGMRHDEKAHMHHAPCTMQIFHPPIPMWPTHLGVSDTPGAALRTRSPRANPRLPHAPILRALEASLAPPGLPHRREPRWRTGGRRWAAPRGPGVCPPDLSPRGQATRHLSLLLLRSPRRSGGAAASCSRPAAVVGRSTRRVRAITASNHVGARSRLLLCAQESAAWLARDSCGHDVQFWHPILAPGGAVAVVPPVRAPVPVRRGLLLVRCVARNPGENSRSRTCHMRRRAHA